MHFNIYPFTGENIKILFNNISLGKLPSKLPDDEIFRNLIISLLKTNQEERISWEKYFNHPFFNDDIELLNDDFSNLNIYDSEPISSFNPFQIFNIKEFPHYSDGCYCPILRDNFFSKHIDLISSNKKALLSFLLCIIKIDFIGTNKFVL